MRMGTQRKMPADAGGCPARRAGENLPCSIAILDRPGGRQKQDGVNYGG